MSTTKSCERCGKHYQRPPRLSAAQWASRRFCSGRCAGLRRRCSDAEVIALYAGGLSSTEVGETLGISGTQVLRILKDNEVAVRDAAEGKRISHSRPWVKRKMSDAATGRRHSEATKERLRQVVGADHPLWRSGLTVSGGYLTFTSSSGNGDHKGRSLHQVVAEWKIRRPLRHDEVVHHIDRNPLNNDPNNLAVMSAEEHGRLHAIEDKPWTKRRKTA